MKRKKIAILDLGTNTFHILITRINGQSFIPLYREKIPVKLGQNGISNNRISKDAWIRAIDTLYYITEIIDREKVSDVYAVATSAIRNAKNGDEFLSEVRDRTGLDIKIIDGDEEAELIYLGVREAVELDIEPALIMDIGGGSVEFIIGNRTRIFWKRSFEIGAQRLLDKFHIQDPISQDNIIKLYKYLESELTLLTKAVNRFHPVSLIGSSGAFDTIGDIHCIKNKIKKRIGDYKRLVDTNAFDPIHRELISKNRIERLQIPGMVPMRADMIVVASCLIDYVINQYSINHLIVSSYSLKEGMLAKLLESEIALQETL